LSGERVERRLAAIVSADVASHSRLMGQDEVGTLVRVKALRGTLIYLSRVAHKREEVMSLSRRHLAAAGALALCAPTLIRSRRATTVLRRQRLP